MHYFLKFIFGLKFYMFRIVPLSIIRSFFRCTNSNGICHTGLLTAVSHIPLLCVQRKKLLMMDRGTVRNM